FYLADSERNPEFGLDRDDERDLKHRIPFFDLGGGELPSHLHRSQKDRVEDLLDPLYDVRIAHTLSRSPKFEWAWGRRREGRSRTPERRHGRPSAGSPCRHR